MHQPNQLSHDRHDHLGKWRVVLLGLPVLLPLQTHAARSGHDQGSLRAMEVALAEPDRTPGPC